LDSAQDEISSQLAEVESRELANVENALERMRAGQYGVCESSCDAIRQRGCLRQILLRE
jgi:DnaK suppressor protein